MGQDKQTIGTPSPPTSTLVDRTAFQLTLIAVLLRFTPLLDFHEINERVLLVVVITFVVDHNAAFP